MRAESNQPCLLKDAKNNWPFRLYSGSSHDSWISQMECWGTGLIERLRENRKTITQLREEDIHALLCDMVNTTEGYLVRPPRNYSECIDDLHVKQSKSDYKWVICAATNSAYIAHKSVKTKSSQQIQKESLTRYKKLTSKIDDNFDRYISLPHLPGLGDLTYSP